MSLLVTKSNANAVMVVVNRLTKNATFFATKTTDDTTEIAKVFIKKFTNNSYRQL